MEIEKRHGNILLMAIAVRENNKSEDTSIRSLVSITRLTERECEIAASMLISEGLLVDHEESIGPKTNLKISEDGIKLINDLNKESSYEFGSYFSVKYQIDQIKKDEVEAEAKKAVDTQAAFDSHKWVKMGSHAGGSGQITRDKWYPMGSYCVKCGITTKKFKANPIVCPKK